MLFENKFVCTEEFYNDYYQYIYFKMPRKVVINIMLVIAFIGGISIADIQGYGKLYGIILMNNNNIFMWLIVLQVYNFFMRKKMKYKRDLELNGGKPKEVKLIVTENEINYLTSGGSNISIELVDIKNAMVTKNYYILFSKAQITFVFKKDSFMTGTAVEFEKFLRQRQLIKKDRPSTTEK